MTRSTAPDGDGEDRGASPSGDRAVVNGAGQAVSALRASVPSADIRLKQAALAIAFAKNALDDEEARVRAFLEGRSEYHQILGSGLRMLDEALCEMFDAQAMSAGTAETPQEAQGCKPASAVRDSECAQPEHHP